MLQLLITSLWLTDLSHFFHELLQMLRTQKKSNNIFQTN